MNRGIFPSNHIACLLFHLLACGESVTFDLMKALFILNIIIASLLACTFVTAIYTADSLQRSHNGPRTRYEYKNSAVSVCVAYEIIVDCFRGVGSVPRSSIVIQDGRWLGVF